MKKINFIISSVIASLVLGCGFFLSCSAGEDNSESIRAYEEAAKREREAAEWTKLNNIGISITETFTNGIVSERGSGTAGGIARKYSDNTKKYAVIYFEAIPEAGYKFNFVGLDVSTEPASNEVQTELYQAKENFFSVTVPIETKIVTINASSAFVAQQP